ncbi:MAG TPA: carboxypeptidase-like regulatory domain-containing protein, partial [Solirubrobacteraceae bacterium]|nr:carboxypeptidase-like regulatory domain-containing protein [Solirubrobacteraceae bacterium]
MASGCGDDPPPQLNGRVVAADGLAIAGATVVARPAPLGGAASAGAGRAGARATSTKRGGFALPLGEGSYSVEVRVPGFTPAVVHEVAGGRA